LTSKLRVFVGRNVDVSVLPQKPRQEPVLLLADPFAVPKPRPPFLGQVVAQPLGALGDLLDQARRDSGLLLELAERRSPAVVLAFDPALGHLPGVVGIIEPGPDE